MDVKVSVIIPALNVENHIEDCVNSVLKQTLNELEILVIDGGSIDKTCEKVMDMITKDSRIKLINSNQKSYGYQVNLGIKYAIGKYVAIVESDDTIEQDGIERLFELAEINGVDIIKADFKIFVTDKCGNKLYKEMIMFKDKKKHLYNKIITCKEYPWLLKSDRYLWKGLYNRQFLLENEIRLNETKGAAYQDVGFLFQTLILAKRLMYVELFFYNYRKDNEGSSVYSINGIEYIANEFSYVKQIIDKRCIGYKDIYLPYFYQTLIQMTTTRYKMFFLLDEYIEPKEEHVKIIQNFLIEGVASGFAYKEGYSEADCEKILLFVNDYSSYKQMIKYKVASQRAKMNALIDQIAKAENIVIWGCGEYGNMLKMLLAKKEVVGEIIECDKDDKKVMTSKGTIKSVQEVMEYDNVNTLYVVCSSEYKHEIRTELQECYRIPKERICFYELGINMYLLKV